MMTKPCDCSADARCPGSSWSCLPAALAVMLTADASVGAADVSARTAAEIGREALRKP